MDHKLREDDCINLSKDFGIHPIFGMESVVATVSGYHGTERFKVIKLIACCGANYVGSMDRSVTHLVCWQLEGKKYDLSRKFETLVISHCWFEDCLKEGRRLPEGPYTMQSGQEVGPILWEVPAILEEKFKRRGHFLGERNVESNSYKASHSGKGKEINVVCLNWSDSHLLKENYFHGWNVKKRLSISEGGGKSRKLSRKSHHSNRHQIANIDDPSIWPECSSRSSSRLRNMRNFHDENEERRIFNENKERRVHKEDLIEPNEFSNFVNSDSPKRCNALTIEGDSKSINSVEIRGTDHKDEKIDCNEPSAIEQQKELSCVICWTEFCSSRGLLPCGHRFCYSCIQEWADCMASRGKISTCPLCKTNFTSITKFEELAASEQKIFSQSIPCGSSKLDIFGLSNKEYDTFRSSSADSICFECKNREPEDLLLSCHICQIQLVHSCCLDPPLIPWTCIHCRDFRMLYQRFR